MGAGDCLYLKCETAFLGCCCTVVHTEYLFVCVAPFAPQLPAPTAMAGQSAEFGLRSTEDILRGGKMLQPALITGLRRSADGNAFVALTKESASLSRFLTGKGLHGRPLSNTLVLETLRKTRNLMVEQLLNAVRAAAGVEAVPLADAPLVDALADDQLAALDLGDDGVSGGQGSPGTKKGRAPRKVILLAQLPDSVVVNYPGSDWQVEVLTELGYRTVYMRFTVENMDTLFSLVQRDLSSGAIKRKRFS